MITAYGLTICLVGPFLGAMTSSFDRRGLLAISLAAVIGMPLGSYLGNLFGWRFAMWVLTLPALLGACLILATVPRQLFVAPLKLSALKDIWVHPALIWVISVSAIQYAGQATLISYLIVVLQDSLRVEALAISLFFALFGVWGVVGNLFGARLIDRMGAAQVVALSIGFMIAALIGLRLAWGHPAATAIVLVIWGLGAFIVNGATQVRIVDLAPLLAPVAIALNSSFIYLSQGSGAAMGGLILELFDSRLFPVVGVSMLTLALVVSLWTQRRIRRLEPARQ